MRVVPYSPEHADEMRAVCLATASERARADETYAAFTLLMYCDPYLEHGTCLMLVDDDGVARGYVLCCEDFSTWRQDFAPYAKRIAALGHAYARRLDEEYAYYESVAEDYPAHLHIDIDGSFQGKGGGRILMETLLDRLRRNGVRGISFGVAAANERAVGFYRHMGFSELTDYDNGEVAGMTFCMLLSPEAAER